MPGFEASDLFLITGASSGIGAETARLFNRLGATVVACGRDPGRLEALKKEAAAPERLHPEIRDLAVDQDQLPDWVKALSLKYGPFRGLVHCAGLSRPRPLRMLTAASMGEVFAVNLIAAAMLAKGLAANKVNLGPGGSITFIASVAASRPTKGQLDYAASKGGLISLAKALSQELAPKGLRVNCISPDLIDTPMSAAVIREENQLHPLGPGRPEDVAALAAFLAGAEARWITGQNYVLDGGRG